MTLTRVKVDKDCLLGGVERVESDPPSHYRRSCTQPLQCVGPQNLSPLHSVSSAWSSGRAREHWCAIPSAIRTDRLHDDTGSCSAYHGALHDWCGALMLPKLLEPLRHAIVVEDRSVTASYTKALCHPALSTRNCSTCGRPIACSKTRHGMLRLRI